MGTGPTMTLDTTPYLAFQKCVAMIAYSKLDGRMRRMPDRQQTFQTKIERLPKWAQAHIEKLKRDLAYAHAKLEAGPEDSDTFADPHHDVQRPLGKRPTIAFQMGEDRWDRILIYRTEDGELDICGSGILAVMPRASNSLRVRQL